MVGLAGGTDAKFAGSRSRQNRWANTAATHQPIALTAWWTPRPRGRAPVALACVEECPMMIEHVDAIVDMRRHHPEKGATPNKGASEVLENLIATTTRRFAPGGRLNWAADLNLPLLSDKKAVAMCCSGSAPSTCNQRTLRAFVKVRLVSPRSTLAVLGLEERDSGDVAAPRR